MQIKADRFFWFCGNLKVCSRDLLIYGFSSCIAYCQNSDINLYSIEKINNLKNLSINFRHLREELSLKGLLSLWIFETPYLFVLTPGIFRTTCQTSVMMFQMVLNTSLWDSFNHIWSVSPWCHALFIFRISFQIL